MAIRNARQSGDVLFDLIDIDALRNSFQQDSRGRSAQWDGRMQNDGRDNYGDSRVCVETPAKIGQPDEEGRSDDTDIAHSIPENVQEHACHVQVLTFALFFAAIMSLMDMVDV